MTIESALAFSLAMFVLAVTPGPGIFASVAQALSSGFRSSFPVIMGIVLGDILFLMLAILGLSAVAHLLGEFFFTVKILGGAYLVWMGLKLWVTDSVSFSNHADVGKKNGWKRFLSGLFITLGNPKVILFYVGFLPTFMDLKSLTFTDTAIVAAIVTVVLTSVLGVYSFSASNARRFFKSPQATKYLNRSAGTMLAGTGVVIATR